MEIYILAYFHQNQTQAINSLFLMGNRRQTLISDVTGFTRMYGNRK